MRNSAYDDFLKSLSKELTAEERNQRFTEWLSKQDELRKTSNFVANVLISSTPVKYI
jgi:hypothetical protein